jgi:uncharacterized protein YceK
MKKQLLLLGIVAILASGCASTRLYATSQPSNYAKDAVTIVVQRDKAWFGGGIKCIVYDNGVAVGQLGSGGCLEWKRASGVYRLSTRDPRETISDLVIRSDSVSTTWGTTGPKHYALKEHECVDDSALPGERHFYSCHFQREPDINTFSISIIKQRSE